MKKVFKTMISGFLCTLLLSLSLIPPYVPKVSAAEYPIYGVVNFRTKDCNTNTLYTRESGEQGYTNGCYGADAAFLGIENGMVKFKMSGVIGYVNPNDVEIRNMDPETITTYISNYRVKNGELQHVIQLDVNNYKSGNVITIGRAPSNLSEGTYYSYDGIYFYPDTLDGFKMMIDDYKGGTSYRAVNANQPYYNYYQYLPTRTISNYTSEDLKVDFSSYTSKMTGYPAKENESQLYGEHVSFIEYQNEYGVNAMMALGLAKNESAMGKSQIAYNKNNLFGIAVYDSNTGAGKSFATVRESIRYFDKNLISEGYLDPKDAGGRYHGGHFGNKGAGFSVKYASDPYWGDKEASYYYNFDKAYGNQDYNKYTIGIKGTNGNYNIKKEPTTSSVSLYQTTKNRNVPFVILDTITNSEGTWFKVQTDPTLAIGRNSIIQDNGAYDFNNNYGYIHSSIITYISNGTGMKSRYTIDFNPNGGRFIDGETSTKRLTVEEYVTPELADPVRDGYTFAGWDQTVMPAQSNKTYTAVWKSNNPQKYTITFDANGGTFEDGSTTKTQTLEEGSRPSEPKSPTKNGYTFVGWDSEISLVTGNKTYKAVWEKVLEKYNITFDANGGKFNDNKETKTVVTTEGQKPQVPENPTKDGYIFQGWDKEIIEAVGNTTYTAVWEKEKATYKITFDASGGTFEDGKEKQVVNTLEGNVPEEPKAPTKSGYKFIGWDKEIVVADGDTTYKAQWEKVKTYAITFDADGGVFENGKDKLTINVEENTKPSVSNPTKDGYIFQGWDREITNALEDTTYKAIWKELTLDDLEERDGLFYIDSFVEKDGKLTLKGYNTIEGINNTLDTDIDYTLIFEDVNRKKEVLSESAKRITDSKEHPFPIYSVDGKDYTYAWFEMNIDISKLPEGNYTMYMVANTDQYYSKKVVNNLTNSKQDASYEQDNKNVIIRNNYNYENSPIELLVRNASEMDVHKNVGTYYNQFDTYTTFEFTNDNLLHMRGLSYSYGMDLSNRGTTTRKVLFENQDNYKVYSKDLGYITTGDYTAPLPEDDHLGKDRAWYDQKINISDIPKGTYVLYTTTTSQGKTDISEMTEKMGRSLDDVVKIIDGKHYSFRINYQQNSRIEMIVE